MNTSHGWVKLYRCLLDDAVCQKSAYFHLWVTLLLMAAHKEHEFIFNNRIHKLMPGQLITGRNGVWEIFTGTTHGEMIDRRMKLRGTKPLDLNQLRKRYKIPCG